MKGFLQMTGGYLSWMGQNGIPPPKKWMINDDYISKIDKYDTIDFILSLSAFNFDPHQTSFQVNDQQKLQPHLAIFHDGALKVCSNNGARPCKAQLCPVV